MSKQDSLVEIKIPAKSEFLRIVRLMISGFASQLAMSMNEVENMKVAVSEACNTAIDYAESTNSGGTLQINCWEASGKIVFEILDMGIGALVVPPDDSEDEEHLERGLGFLLIQTLMDEVDVQTTPESGTKITMKKNISAA